MDQETKDQQDNIEAQIERKVKELLPSLPKRKVHPKPSIPRGESPSEQSLPTIADIPHEFLDLADELAAEADTEQITIIKQGLVLRSLAQKAKQQGLKVAVVDTKGEIRAFIDGF